MSADKVLTDDDIVAVQEFLASKSSFQGIQSSLSKAVDAVLADVFLGRALSTIRDLQGKMADAEQSCEMLQKDFDDCNADRHHWKARATAAEAALREACDGLNKIVPLLCKAMSNDGLAPGEADLCDSYIQDARTLLKREARALLEAGK